jgi:hypothetical protein
MGQQAIALGCAVHHVSNIETGRILPTAEYIDAFSRWLNLEGSQYEALKKRNKSNVTSLRNAGSSSNNSTSMRLFRKVSKMDSDQIRRFRTKIQGEAENERRLPGPAEIS